MLGAILVALAGPGYVNSEVPDPLGPMEISNLTLRTGQAGMCPVDPLASSANSASVRLQWRAVNRDDDAYRIDVYLDVAGQLFAQNKLGSPDLNFMFTGWAPKTWEQGWEDIVTGFGEFFNSGYVEGGLVSPVTVDWTFRVQLVRLVDGVIVQELRAPWRKTYGLCE